MQGYIVKLGYDSDLFSANALVDMYAKAICLEDAVSVFEKFAQPDIVSWNAVIAGCILHNCHGRALKLFRQLSGSGIRPNMFTISSALKACAGMGFEKLGRRLHSFLIKKDTESDSYVKVGLIDMYCKCEIMTEARVLLNMMPMKDMIACNAVISGHSQMAEDIGAAAKVCEQVHSLSVKTGFRSDRYVINSLLDTYGKCGQVENAVRIFEECKSEDLVAFTSMITAYAHSLLNACANLSAYEQGKQIHVHILKYGFLSDAFAGNSLVNMYSKCGSIDDAGRAFSKVPERGIVSWSAMIGGLAQHGHGKEAINMFNQMLRDGICPNHITLVSVLCACNHAGLVTEARIYFESMKELFGVVPREEHYACMIDLLGRAGKIKEAMVLVNTMPFQAKASVLGSLLGAARIHKNVELGERAADMLFVLEPEKSGAHVLLANIQGDRNHWRSKELYAKLDELLDSMHKAGYVPMVEIDLHDVEQSEKERLLRYHSEKLAVAFALIATPPGAPIRVKKNISVYRLPYCIQVHL
ncbi:hypothetical protein ACLB2K_032805 [Fragaria x ananassa]